MGHELNDNGFLVTGNSFGCQSDWPDMVRYCRKLNVCVKFLNDIAVVSDADGNILNAKKLCFELINVSIKSDLHRASTMSFQGSFFTYENINRKCSHSIYYNWNVNDDLLKFTAKARLSILPTKFTTYIWNRENNPFCPFGCNKNESMAHLLNGCLTFKNFYSRRHNRIVNKIAEFIVESNHRLRIVVDKCADKVFARFDAKELSTTGEIVVIGNRRYGFTGLLSVAFHFVLYLIHVLVAVLEPNFALVLFVLGAGARLFGGYSSSHFSQ